MQQLCLWPGIKFSSGDINKTAIHEAAHAVIAIKKGVKFNFVTIRRKKGSDGRLQLEGAMLSKNNKKYRDALDVLMAGVVVEHFLSKDLKCAEGDSDQVVSIATIVANYKDNKEFVSAIIETAVERVGFEFFTRSTWEQVEAVAIQLERNKTLIYDEVVEIIMAFK